MKKILSILIILIIPLLGFSSVRAEAEGASLYLSPNSGTFFVGSTFDVSIFVNTNGENVNAVKVDLKFDPKKLQIASPTAGKSFISVWVSQPTYSNLEGRASFRGGVPSPGIKTSSGLISTLTFRAVSPGEATILLSDSSQVLRDDGKGTDILSSLGRGKYTLQIPPPAGPKVFSSSHPDQNKWYKNNNPTLSWEKERSVTAFSYLVDNNFYGIPDDISEGDHTSVSYNELKDGIWYFHIKAKKGDFWGGISHYLLQIDNTSPADFPLVFKPALRSPTMTSKEPIVSFVTTDALSGVDYFEIKIVHLHETLVEKDVGFFFEVTSPYKLPILCTGEHEVVIRAFDKALNWRESSEKIDVVPVDQPIYLTKSGINFFTFFLKWWQVALILLPLVVILLFIALRWRKIYKRFHQRRKILDDIKQRTKKEEEELKRKITKTE